MQNKYGQDQVIAIQEIDTLLFETRELLRVEREEKDRLDNMHWDKSARALSEIQAKLRNMCNTYAHLSECYGSRLCEVGATNDQLVAMRETQREVMVYSPLLTRLRYNNSGLPVSGVIDCAAQSARTCWIDRGGALAAYLLAVYPVNHPRRLIDPDNLVYKPLLDAACRRAGVDDSGDTVSVIIYGVRTDQLPEGMYLLLRALDRRPLSSGALLRHIRRLHNTD